MKPHLDVSLGNSLTVASNLSCSVYVGVFSTVVYIDVDNSINGEWASAFDAIESEVPAVTAVQTERESVISVELNFQCSIIGMLYKFTVLKDGKTKK